MVVSAKDHMVSFSYVSHVNFCALALGAHTLLKRPSISSTFGR